MWAQLQIGTLLVALSSVLSCLALSSPPSGAITVGPGGKYATLSAALADTSSSVYFLYSGTYKEQVYITRANLKIYGQTSTPNSYTGNTVTITYGLSAAEAGSDDLSGTVRVHATNVAMYNINIVNTYGQGSQAIALSVYGGQFGAYGLKLTGYQDTLLAQTGAEFYGNCWIEGATDFIFGQHASIWITNSVINTVASGWITASGRSSNDGFWYVINNSIVQGTGTAYLGRPWADYARVVFQNTYLHSNVPAAGWSQWSTSTPNTDHVTFAEYGNTGAGASGTRASFATKLTAPISILTVLNSTSWVDPAFL